RYVLETIGVMGVLAEFMKLLRNAFGVFPTDQRDYQPVETLNISKWASRAYLLVIAAVFALSISLRSFEPLMYAVLPSFYGRFYMVVLGITQHAGLAEDVIDHRLNTRTIYMGPLNRWIYWNMNYHVEHHMYPSVPFHQLKNLHETIKSQLPKPYPSLWSALREVIPALRKQATDETYFVKRTLPIVGA
ncbi:MAG: fatty acid desaturase, partial [Acidimicrobiia bacterium]|nr:fatty acid desaturase [Acidimicrobiia bacterium]